jgi:hypothetical protein
MDIISQHFNAERDKVCLSVFLYIGTDVWILMEEWWKVFCWY